MVRPLLSLRCLKDLKMKEVSIPPSVSPTRVPPLMALGIKDNDSGKKPACVIMLSKLKKAQAPRIM
jgi:hypothetical protein